MLTVDAKGVFPIAPTPFLTDGSIDEASVDRMIDHYVAAGADGSSSASPRRDSRRCAPRPTLLWPKARPA
jgi:hypothetical protein